MAVVQGAMVYGSDTWVMKPRISRFLGGFHHSVSHRLTGQQPWRGREGGWVYPILEEAMAEARVQEVETYVYRHQKTVVQFISTRTIMNLCLVLERCTASRMAKHW